MRLACLLAAAALAASCSSSGVGPDAADAPTAVLRVTPETGGVRDFAASLRSPAFAGDLYAWRGDVGRDASIVARRFPFASGTGQAEAEGVALPADEVVSLVLVGGLGERFWFTTATVAEIEAGGKPGMSRTLTSAGPALERALRNFLQPKLTGAIKFSPKNIFTNEATLQTPDRLKLRAVDEPQGFVPKRVFVWVGPSAEVTPPRLEDVAYQTSDLGISHWVQGSEHTVPQIEWMADLENGEILASDATPLLLVIQEQPERWVYYTGEVDSNTTDRQPVPATPSDTNGPAPVE